MVAKYLYDAWGNCTISSESTNTAVAAAVGAGIGMAVSYSATGTLTASFTDIRFDFALKAAKMAITGSWQNLQHTIILARKLDSASMWKVLQIPTRCCPGNMDTRITNCNQNTGVKCLNL